MRDIAFRIVAAAIAIVAPISLTIAQSAAKTDVAKRFEMGFYDVGTLYDTLRSDHYDHDRYYTPKGILQWTPQRYNRKVRNIAAAIDSLKMPVVALFGVENEGVVDDIVAASNLHYSSIHRTLDFYNKGLDFALLYYADMLFIEQIASNGYLLYISATTADGERVAIHLSTRGYKILNTERPEVYGEYPTVEELNAPVDITIVWGKFTSEDLERLELAEVLKTHSTLYRSKKGETYNQRYRWHFDSRIGVRTTTERKINAEIYHRDWLLSPNRVQPEPTYTLGNRYRGGYSKHLPQYIVIE